MTSCAHARRDVRLAPACPCAELADVYERPIERGSHEPGRAVELRIQEFLYNNRNDAKNWVRGRYGNDSRFTSWLSEAPGVVRRGATSADTRDEVVRTGLRAAGNAGCIRAAGAVPSAAWTSGADAPSVTSNT